MDANSILIRHWEDVVFEHRNKAYGAYLLRRAYSQRLMVGVAVTLTVVALILLLQRIYSSEKLPAKVKPPLADAGTILSQPPSIERPHPPKGVVHHSEANRQNQLVIVTEPVDPPEIDAIRDFVSVDSQPGDVGVADGEGVLPVAVELSPAAVEPKIVDIAEIMPSYEGGMEAMMKFIQKQIRYPRAPRQMGIEGTVYVRFVVNGDGSLSDVRILRGFHPDCDKEALRVVSMLPAWRGGSNNGRPVAVRMVLPIKFSLRNQ